MADSLYCLRFPSNSVGGRASKQNSLSIQSGIHHIGGYRSSPIPVTAGTIPAGTIPTVIPEATTPTVLKLKRQESALTQEEIFR